MKFLEEDLPTPTAMLAELKEWVAHWENDLHRVTLSVFWDVFSMLMKISFQMSNSSCALVAHCQFGVQMQSYPSLLSEGSKRTWETGCHKTVFVGLALVHVGHGLHVDTKKICQKYIQANRRRMFQSSIISQSLDWKVCLTNELYSIDEFTPKR